MRKLVWIAAVAALGSCSKYELDPVTPTGAKLVRQGPILLAQAPPPDVVFVVDRSGSMADAADGSASQVCPASGQQNLDCKWDTLLSVLTGDANPQGGFLNKLAAAGETQPVRMGLVTFSGTTDPASGSIDEACRPGVLAVPVGADTAAAMSSALEALPPGGATPTAASLQVAAQAFPAAQSGLAARRKIIVLLTDGAPNCDPAMAVSPSTCSGDRCTFACDSSGLSTDPRGCLDEDGLVSTIQALQQQGIQTFVIGFGADVSTGAAYETLEKAALAGGQRRVDANQQPLEPAFYPASDRASLLNALGQVPLPQKCTFALDGTPVADGAVEVQVSSCNQAPQTLARGQWTRDQNFLTITDPTVCTELYQATTDCPMKVQLNYVAQ